MIHNNIFIKVLIVILLFFTLSFSAKADSTSQEKRITVVFRFDDYSSRSSTNIEIKLIDAFQKYNIPCTFGVIPYGCADYNNDATSQELLPLTLEKADILKNGIKAGVLEVALHGYSHQSICEGRYCDHTEFSGLDYDDQVKKIEKGKKYLEEMFQLQVATFIPPWNRYDLNTVKVLEKLEFRTLSAGEVGDAKESSPLKFLPVTCHLIHLREAVSSALFVPDLQPVIVVSFHEYDFHEIDEERGNLTFRDFVELLAWVMSQKNIQVRTIDQANTVIDDLSAHRFINYSIYRKLSRLIPPVSPYLRGLYHSGVYLESNNSQNMKLKCWLFILIFYASVLMISSITSFFVGSAVFPRYRLVSLFTMYAILVLLVLVSAYALRNLDLYFKGAIAISTLLGVSLGLWAFFIKFRKPDA
jgi:peptidoglycan/xylan/chitin deacetylase (PgdA/CDA1 family)